MSIKQAAKRKYEDTQRSLEGLVIPEGIPRSLSQQRIIDEQKNLDMERRDRQARKKFRKTVSKNSLEGTGRAVAEENKEVTSQEVHHVWKHNSGEENCKESKHFEPPPKYSRLVKGR